MDPGDSKKVTFVKILCITSKCVSKSCVIPALLVVNLDVMQELNKHYISGIGNDLILMIETQIPP